MKKVLGDIGKGWNRVSVTRVWKTRYIGKRILNERSIPMIMRDSLVRGMQYIGPTLFLMKGIRYR
jgi:hypothetical protein